MRVPSAKAQNRVSTKRRYDTLAPDMVIPRFKKNRVMTNDSVVELCFSCVKQEGDLRGNYQQNLFTKREKEVVILF